MTAISSLDPAATASRVRDFHPGWYASVMGTAIVAVATFQNPGGIDALEGLAQALGKGLAVFAYVLGAVLALGYVARWLRHPAAALADLRHPVLGAMLATLPGGLLVLAVMTGAIGPDLLPDGAVRPVTAVLTGLGATLALIVSIAFTLALFTSEPPAGSVNGGWFIPPVVTIITPAALAPLIPGSSPGTARLLLALGYAADGIGFLLFLFVMGMLYHRLVLHPLPPAPLVPTLWIALGPIGVSALAPMALAGAGQTVFGASAGTVILLSRLFATAIWGLGLWWLAIAVLLLVRYARAGTVPFHLGWWAFTFPLGAYTAATLTLARGWQAPVLEGLGAILYLMLAGFWVIVLGRTLAATRTGAIWRR